MERIARVNGAQVLPTDFAACNAYAGGAHLDGFGFFLAAFVPDEPPHAVGVVALADGDAIVAHQIVRCSWFAARGEVVGRGA